MSDELRIGRDRPEDGVWRFREVGGADGGLALELRDVGAKNVVAFREDLLHRRQNLVLQRLVLRRKIQKRDLHVTACDTVALPGEAILECA